MLEALGCYLCFTEAEKTRANMLNPNTANVRIESQSSSHYRRLKHPLREEESCALANQKKRLAGAFLGPPLEVGYDRAKTVLRRLD
jgi:hypothetical protein